MGVEALPAGDERLKAAFPKLDVDAYALPYFAPSGAQIDFVRFRLMGEYRVNGDKRPLRYLQIPGTTPRLYLPPQLKWKHVLSDPGTELYITEGEKKAALMCKHGLPTIGLGGVFNFLSAGDPIEDLQLVKWSGRRVRIVFDSDAAFKPSVQQAQKRLADELIRRGANPFVVELPTLESATKTGVDDFFVAHGNGKKAKAAFLALRKIPLFMPDGFDFDQLLKMNIPELEYIVRGLLPVGVTLFVGPPKIGKSAFIYDALISLTRGESILAEFPTAPTAVAYLALEDTPRRLKVRGEQLMKARQREKKF